MSLFTDALPRWKPALIVLAVGLTALLALHGAVALDMVQVWWNDTTYNHGFVILPISAWLLWERRVALLSMTPRPMFFALVPLALAAVLMMVGRAGSIGLFEHAAFVGMLICLICAAVGWAIALRFAFPILFLLFMIPVGTELVPTLQYWTAQVSVAMLRASGVPTYLDGIMVQMPHSLFEIAEACAGVRFLIANIAVAFLFAHLSFTRWWKWGFFIALGFIVPVFANFVRAYGIMILAHLTNNAIATGADHLLYGWVFFSLVMLLLIWIGSKFADRQIGDPMDTDLTADPRLPAPRVQWVAITVGIVGLLAAGPLWLPRHSHATLNLAPIAPVDIAKGWQFIAPDAKAHDVWEPVFTGADRRWRLDFIKDGQIVHVFLALFGAQRPGHEVVYYANRFDDDENWRRGQLTTQTVNPGASGLAATARREDLVRLYVTHASTGHSGFQRRMVLSWMQIGDLSTASDRQAKLAQIRNALTHGPQGAAVIAIAADFVEKPAEAQAVIEAFLADLRPVSDWLPTMLVVH